jgi:hypothetical protein
MSVGLVIQHEMRMRYIVICGLSGCTIPVSPRCLISSTNLGGGELLNTEYVLFFSAISFWNISNSNKNSPRYHKCTYIGLPKLSAACYMVRQTYHICNSNTFRSIYFAYFHSIASYGIILGGNSSYNKKILTLQKRIIIIMVGAHHRT